MSRVEKPVFVRPEPPHAVRDWDAEQTRAVEAACSGGATLIVGPPGTGKTTCLVESVSRWADTGDLAGVLVLAHSRGASQRLRSRVVSRVGRSQLGLKFTTLHGFARSLLTAHHPFDEAEWRTLTAPEQERALRDLLSGWPIEGWPTEIREAVGTRRFASELRTVLARARQLGLDPDDVLRVGERAGRDDWSAVGKFTGDYLDVLDARQVMDYPELIHRVRLMLLDEQIARQVTDEVKLIHVDDFAELDTAQVALLADLSRLGIDVIAWADPWTRVNGFRGADPRAVSDFERQFTRPGRPATRVDLRTNHRCGQPIAAAIDRLATRLPFEGGLACPATRSSRDAGEVEARTYDSAAAQYEHVAALLRGWRAEGVGWAHMAVITRAGREGVGRVARALGSAGVPVEVDGDELALAEETSVRILLAGMQAAGVLAQGGRLSSAVACNLLMSPLGGLDAVEVRSLRRALVARYLDHDDEDCRGNESVSGDGERQPLATSGELLASELSRADGFASLDHPAANRAGSLATLLAEAADDVAASEQVETVLWRLWSGTSWPARLRRIALSGEDGSSRAHRELDAVIALFDLASRHPRLEGARGLELIVDEVSGQQIAADTGRESDIMGRGVRVTTAHRARGLEWRRVVLVDVQEGLWPMLRRRGTILDPDRLTPDGIADPEPISAIVAEERRLFILAISRAAERVVVCAADGGDTDGVEASRFLGELGVNSRAESGFPRRPLTRAGLVGELRRYAADGSPLLRRAAAEQLARLASSQGASRALVSCADPAQWWSMSEYTGPEQSLADQPGIKTAEISLSPSQLDTLLTCPRRWFLESRARARTAPSENMAFGTILHAAAERLEQPDAMIEQVRKECDRALARLAFESPWRAEAERKAASAALDGYLSWREMRAREVVGVELPFTQRVVIDGESVTLRGTVDRLERDADGRLWIVDLKTGRSVPSIQAARSHAQLGVYQLVASLGAFDSLTGGKRRVAGAQLLYLRELSVSANFSRAMREQPSIQQVPHLLDVDPTSGGHENWILDRIARAVGVIRSGNYHAQSDQLVCRNCPFRSGCPAQHIFEEDK